MAAFYVWLKALPWGSLLE